MICRDSIQSTSRSAGSYLEYCINCLQPDTRPGTAFKEGVCPACEFYESLKVKSFEDRVAELKNAIKPYLSKNDNQYDAILGVSGGKDSTKLALWAREKLDLRILLVSVTYPPHQLSEIGARNLENLVNFGFDSYQILPSPLIWRELMKKGFLENGNWARSTELALFSGVPQIAIQKNIPLILWGENPALQLGDLKTLGTTAWDGNNVRLMNTLSTIPENWLRDSNFHEKFLYPYFYPLDIEFHNSKLQIIYLGWAMSNWGLLENGIFASLRGLKLRTDSYKNTQDLGHSTSLDEDWVIVNQMFKYYKFGFGRATDFVNEWIRKGYISRDEAINIVERIDGNCDQKYIKSFCNYLGISKQLFWQILRKNTNKNLFYLSSGNLRPIPKFKVGYGLNV